MNIILSCSKIKTALFEWALIIFTIFGCLLWRKCKIKVLLASMKSHTTWENLPENLFLLSIAAFDSKSSSKCRCSHEIVQKADNEFTLEKINQWKQRKDGPEIWCGLWTIFRISKCFQKSKQKLYIYFSLGKAGKKCVRTIITDLISKSFKIHSHLVTQSLSVMSGGHKKMLSFLAD